MSMANYLEDQLINVMFRSASAWKPADIFILLATATIVDSDTGAAGITEPSGNGYARLDSGGPLDSVWDAPSNGSTANSAAQSFAAASGGNWGTLVDFGVADAATNGNLLFYNALDASKIINDGDVAEFEAGDLTVTLD